MQTIRTLFDIILLKAKPGDLPYNGFHTYIAIVSVCLLTLIPASQNKLINEPVFFAIVETLALAALICVFLNINKKKERTEQTLLAVFGTLALFNIAVYILAFTTLFSLAPLLALWIFIVRMIIIQHSLDISKAQAFFINIAIYICVVFILTLVFPETMQEIYKEMQRALEKMQNAQLKNSTHK